MELLGFTLTLLGATGRIWTSTYILGNKNKCLVTSGPYSFTRNPLYFSSFLGAMGIGIATESITVALLIGIFFTMVYFRTIQTEEARLKGMFGSGYDSYANLVPRFWPRLSIIPNVDAKRISPRLSLKALSSGANFIAVYSLVLVSEWAHAHQYLPNLFDLF